MHKMARDSDDDGFHGALLALLRLQAQVIEVTEAICGSEWCVFQNPPPRSLPPSIERA
jgi:hypothetical protein